MDQNNTTLDKVPESFIRPTVYAHHLKDGETMYTTVGNFFVNNQRNLFLNPEAIMFRSKDDICCIGLKLDSEGAFTVFLPKNIKSLLIDTAFKIPGNYLPVKTIAYYED